MHAVNSTPDTTPSGAVPPNYFTTLTPKNELCEQEHYTYGEYDNKYDGHGLPENAPIIIAIGIIFIWWLFVSHIRRNRLCCKS